MFYTVLRNSKFLKSLGLFACGAFCGVSTPAVFAEGPRLDNAFQTHRSETGKFSRGDTPGNDEYNYEADVLEFIARWEGHVLASTVPEDDPHPEEDKEPAPACDEYCDYYYDVSQDLPPINDAYVVASIGSSTLRSLGYRSQEIAPGSKLRYVVNPGPGDAEAFADSLLSAGAREVQLVFGYGSVLISTNRVAAKFKENVTEDARDAILSDLETRLGLKVVNDDHAKGYLLQHKSNDGRETITMAWEERATYWDAFSYFQPEYQFVTRPSLIPDDPLFGTQWNLLQTPLPYHIDVTDAWDWTFGAGVTVAIVDDGVNALHPDLPDVILGVDFATPGGTGAPVTAYDTHGQAAAGIISTQTNNTFGIAGIAPSSELKSVRVAQGTSTGGWLFATEAVTAGLDWSRGAGDADILYMAFSIDTSSCTSGTGFQFPGGVAECFERRGYSAVAEALRINKLSGITQIVASGNGGMSLATEFPFPVNLPSVTPVGAITQGGGIASYTNTGDQLQFAAPGSSVPSISNTGFITTTGTSAAAAHVAGTLALVLSVEDLSPNQLVRAGRATAYRFGGGWTPFYGWGIIQAEAARRAAVQPLILHETEHTSPFRVEVDVLRDDINSDGFRDIVVGIPHTFSDGVEIRSGIDGSLIDSITPAMPQWYGSQVVAAGDIDGDGFGDFLVSAIFQACPELTPWGVPVCMGVVEARSGATRELLYNVYEPWPATNRGTLYGWRVRMLHDVDADGVDDFAVTAPLHYENGLESGAVYTYSGATGARLRQIYGTAGSALGYSVAKGEGSTMAVGAPGFSAGAAYQGQVLVYNATGFGSPLASVAGDAVYRLLGYSLADGDDMDSDSNDDFLVGAPGGPGVVYALSSNSLAELSQFRGAEIGDHIGIEVRNVGDINNDTFDDYVIGAPSDDIAGQVNVGSAIVLNGEDFSEVRKISGSQEDERFGRTIAGGDLNEDGFSDFLVGAGSASFANSLRAFSGVRNYIEGND